MSVLVAFIAGAIFGGFVMCCLAIAIIVEDFE